MSRVKIYYLDDEPELLILFKETFDSDEIEITTFSEPESLIKAVSLYPPNLVFLDYRLPSTTGQEVALKLPSEIPKVLITGDLNINDLKGFAAVFTKPLSMNEIQKYIERLL